MPLEGDCLSLLYFLMAPAHTTMIGALLETTVFSDVTFNCNQPWRFCPGAPICHSWLTFCVPGPVKFRVEVAQVPPSKLTQVYLTSAGPSVVMVPAKYNFTGQDALSELLYRDQGSPGDTACSARGRPGLRLACRCGRRLLRGRKSDQRQHDEQGQTGLFGQLRESRQVAPPKGLM